MRFSIFIILYLLSNGIFSQSKVQHFKPYKTKYVYIDTLNSNHDLKLDFDVVEAIETLLKEDSLIVLNSLDTADWPLEVKEEPRIIVKIIPRIHRNSEVLSCGVLSLKIIDYSDKVLWVNTRAVTGNYANHKRNPCNSKMLEEVMKLSHIARSKLKPLLLFIPHSFEENKLEYKFIGLDSLSSFLKKPSRQDFEGLYVSHQNTDVDSIAIIAACHPIISFVPEKKRRKKEKSLDYHHFNMENVIVYELVEVKHDDIEFTGRLLGDFEFWIDEKDVKVDWQPEVKENFQVEFTATGELLLKESDLIIGTYSKLDSF